MWPDCVPEAVRGNPRYAGDHLIRHYQTRGLAAYLRDRGGDPATPEVTIVGGIGTLVLRPGGSQFTPVHASAAAPAALPPAQPLPAPPDLVAHRRGICGACDRSAAGRCTVAGCACAGLGQPERRLSRCPEGRW